MHAHSICDTDARATRTHKHTQARLSTGKIRMWAYQHACDSCIGHPDTYISTVRKQDELDEEAFARQND